MKSEIIITQEPQTNSAVDSVFDIMSEGYKENRYMAAMNVSCNILVNGGKYNTPQTIEMTVYEFAPFTDTSDFCLIVNDENKEICSGSKKFQGILKRNYTAKKMESSNSILKGFTAWTMKLKMKRSSKYLPKVRYWMKIKGQ